MTLFVERAVGDDLIVDLLIGDSDAVLGGVLLEHRLLSELVQRVAVHGGRGFVLSDAADHGAVLARGDLSLVAELAVVIDLALVTSQVHGHSGTDIVLADRRAADDHAGDDEQLGALAGLVRLKVSDKVPADVQVGGCRDLLERLLNDAGDLKVTTANGEVPKLPVRYLGVRGSLHRRDIYDDVD